jgi:hypothetical protein
MKLRVEILFEKRNDLKYILYVVTDLFNCAWKTAKVIWRRISDFRTIMLMMICTGCEGALSWCILKYYPIISLKELKRFPDNLSQDTGLSPEVQHRDS